MYTLIRSMSHKVKVILTEQKCEVNTSLAAKGALAHRLQRRTACNNSPPDSFYENLIYSKWPPGGPKMADRV